MARLLTCCWLLQVAGCSVAIELGKTGLENKMQQKIVEIMQNNIALISHIS